MKNKQEYVFFIDKINEQFPGLAKLIEKIRPIFGNVSVINSLDSVESDEKYIIPLGTVAAYFYLKKFKKGGIAFIIDAYTLGFYSVSRFYLKRGDLFNKDLWGAMLRYVKYHFIEKNIINSFDKVIVVSEHDANYLREKYKSNNIFVVPNGADFPDMLQKQEKTFDFTLGILSYWGSSSIKDVSWFIEEYMPQLKKIYPDIKLITAGRGANADVIQYFENHNVTHLGEIDDLWQFFNKIDIYITTLRKECGILNKVLDAMAHKKIVVGLEYNMYAFKQLNNGFLSYSTLDDLTDIIESIATEKIDTNEIIDNAYQYIENYHNWTVNYHNFKTLVDNYFDTSN